jgi:signal transduction histidine kinase
MSKALQTERPAAGSGLFRRIYITFVITVFLAALVGAGTAWLFTERDGEAWVGDSLALLADEHDEIIALLDDRVQLATKAESLGTELDTEVAIYDGGGMLLVGHGPPFVPDRARRHSGRLESGQPLVHPRPGGRRVVLYPLVDPELQVLVGFVHVKPRPIALRGPLLVSVAFMLGLLGLGAWGLSRSLTRRLGRLERSADRIAGGDLAHRVAPESTPPRDEIDVLGIAFNQMADKLQKLVDGQRILLANVSHELRTPIARVRVLIEILEDRVDRLAAHAGPDGNAHAARLRSGLAEMTTDTTEIEALIADLLTSGRLELAGQGESLELHDVDLAAMLRRRADRFGARVEADGRPRMIADEMLLERLVSNLLANARRACPDGDVAIYVSERDGEIEIAVEDEGHGIATADREQIFEPFRRLDAARSRDKGGVGLGLYLCRQICRAHGGEIRADGRLDGRPGARMVITFPRDR